MMRVILFFGSSSYYVKEGRAQSENFYLLAPEMTANVVLVGFLILQGWMPFVGINITIYLIRLWPIRF